MLSRNFAQRVIFQKPCNKASIKSKTGLAVHFSSEKKTWETPQDLFDVLNEELPECSISCQKYPGIG